MTQEAMKLSQEALAGLKDVEKQVRELIAENKALKEALAKSEQEPVATVESVATVVSESGNQEVTMSWWHEPALPVGTKLYTIPPKRTWVGLTDEEYKELHLQIGPVYYYQEYGQAIEAKLKEKNT